MGVALKSTNKFLSFSMVSVASLVAIVLTVLLVHDVLIHKESERDSDIEGNRRAITSRKLLQSAVADRDTNRIGKGCSKDDIVIYQGQVGPLPSGIPGYRVEITNMCGSDCNISKIRLHCGWFSSARLINPKVFRRVRYNDCLVNDGEALGPGKTISFEYANTFSYPLSVSSVVCSKRVMS
ncbi:TPD1 protein homolog 1 [Cajanus cajan]|nr:TPD1 protein homolog 1 [Cajanus cajan]